MSAKRIQFIINPAAGNDEPILNIINNILKDTDVDWQVSVTHKAGDGAKLAREAVADGVDIVVAYGGDGTLLDVAGGMLNSAIPLGLVAGGTANAFIEEVGVPRPIEEAVKLLIGDYDVRAVDVGEINGEYFLLRAGTGLVEDFSVGVNRDMKDKYGLIAYFIGTAKALVNVKTHKYILTIDGVRHETEGVMCLLTNASSTGGQAGVRIAKDIQIDDGLLDIIIPKGNFQAMVDVVLTAAHVERESFQSESVHYFQGKSVTIETEEPMGLFADGEEEPIAMTPCTVNLLPQVLKIIVPKAQA